MQSEIVFYVVRSLFPLTVKFAQLPHRRLSTFNFLFPTHPHPTCICIHFHICFPHIYIYIFLSHIYIYFSLAIPRSGFARVLCTHSYTQTPHAPIPPYAFSCQCDICIDFSFFLRGCSASLRTLPLTA